MANSNNDPLHIANQGLLTVPNGWSLYGELGYQEAEKRLDKAMSAVLVRLGEAIASGSSQDHAAIIAWKQIRKARWRERKYGGANDEGSEYAASRIHGAAVLHGYLGPYRNRIWYTVNA